MAITTSQTEIDAIDALYPVAGQDNDSQGFRDNFSNIKNTLTKVKTDLSAIDGTTAQGVAHSVDDGVHTNDFNGNIIQEAKLIATTETIYPIGDVSTSQNINWSSGNYQNITVANSITLTLTSWPDHDAAKPKLAKLRLRLKSDNTGGRTVTWSAGGGDLKYASDWPTPFTLPTDENQHLIVDFWTEDGGSTIYAEYVGQFE